VAQEKVSTGIRGLDDILNGGYLKGKPTLLKGGPGTGKTIYTLFFAHAQVQANESVIYLTCDEKPEQIISHMDNFGLEGSKLQKQGKICILDFTPEFSDQIVGEFELSALLLRVEQAKIKYNATTLIIDSLQSLLLGLGGYDPHLELLNLFHWARQERLTTLTTIADIKTILHYDIYEEYVVDCAIELEQTIQKNLMTRYIRILKLRGSPHGTNKYPFAILHNGINIIPITQTRLNTKSGQGSQSTGIKKLDEMLGGEGYRFGSTILLSGRSGTAKSLFAANFAKEAAENGKKVLYISFEESPDDFIRHTQSANVDLLPCIKKKKLTVHARRSVEMGLEDHILSMIEMDEHHEFDIIILDPISSLLDLGSILDVKMIFIRFISYMKSKNKTLLFTELLPDSAGERSFLGLSSLIDTWIRLSHVANNGELNRLLFIAKSRGTKTSNQIKEFVISDTGIHIEEPYIGDKEMVFGSQKAAFVLRDKQESNARLEEISHLNTELYPSHLKMRTTQISDVENYH